ncbi:Hypothetical protein, putative [Bodo saltans]|uniref:Uncharacterized protein n=1 Tax=Bodo saltans TaxID=75058 RepID=A0A0S4INY1_BODSA|nr:Hypothetical protein, putative [Bodo saltans]|eukprot:CUE97672.1 Hypothetical protein, putative [Bodo saltans]
MRRLIGSTAARRRSSLAVSIRRCASQPQTVTDNVAHRPAHLTTSIEVINNNEEDMKSTALLATPKSCAIAAQPYQTIAGPALSVTFAFDDRLHPFQQREFHAAAVPSLYAHSLLDHLAEFSETKRTLARRRTNDLQVAPLPDFWKRVGNLNTVYCTLHRVSAVSTSSRRQQLCISSEHPAAGSIELTPSAHRRSNLLDIRSTLHDANYQPLATILWTGTEDGVVGGVARLETSESEEQHDLSMQRAQIFDSTGAVLPTRNETVQVEGVVAPDHSEDDLHHAEAAPGTTAPYIVRSRCVRLKDGGVAALGAFRSVLHEENHNNVGSHEQPAAPSFSPVVVPPWMVLDLVSLFVRCAVASLQDIAPNHVPGDHTNPHQWMLASYHHSQGGDIDAAAGEGVEIVSGVPKVFPSYTMPPWKHHVGLPMLRGEPCMAWHIELRQHGVLVSSGVYYFTTGVKS